MENYELKITKAENGFIVEWEEEVENGFKQHFDVFEDKVGEVGEKEAMCSTLRNVAEYFGFIYDKYAENNIDINANLKGHKLD